MLYPAMHIDLPAIEALYERTIKDLNRRGLYQWNDAYPNRQTFERAITTQTMFLYKAQVQAHESSTSTSTSTSYLVREDEKPKEDQIIGAVILDEHQAKEWVTINWQFKKGQILVIHALVIDPTIQGKGLGKELLRHCEQYALDHDYQAIRLDAFRENPAVLRFYENTGYQRLGEVFFDFKPKGCEWYVCWEKVL